jgi:hypothetical protein
MGHPCSLTGVLAATNGTSLLFNRCVGCYKWDIHTLYHVCWLLHKWDIHALQHVCCLVCYKWGQLCSSPSVMTAINKTVTLFSACDDCHKWDSHACFSKFDGCRNYRIRGWFSRARYSNGKKSWLPLIDLYLRQSISLTIAEKAAIDTNLNLNLSYI